METMTRSALARRAGVGAETLRYYEQRGLLPRPSRSAANYRLYGAEDERRLCFIQRAKGLGFTLKEIADLLSLRASPRRRCARVARRTAAKIEDIESRIECLKRMQSALEALLLECRGRRAPRACPILDALEGEQE